MRVSAKLAVAASEGGGRQGREAVVPRAKGIPTNSRRNRVGGSRAETATETAVSYDSSDSFENHVIDLRGDEYRGANLGNEDDQTLRDTQSSEEVRLHISNGRRESDSDMDVIQPNHSRPFSNGTIVKHQHGTKADHTLQQRVNRKPPGPRQHDFVPGQLVWAKLARFPWWPAQVMDGKEAKEGTKGTPASETDLLVRFFGTYDYGWVDPFTNLSDFDVKLAERSRIRKKALQKGVEEALAFQTSGNLPEKWEPAVNSPESKKNQNRYSNGVTMESPEESKASPGDDELKERKTPRKRKPKVLFEEEVRVERKPQRMLRRLRVMRQLGLVAPAGSPFTSDYN